MLSASSVLLNLTFHLICKCVIINLVFRPFISNMIFDLCFKKKKKFLPSVPTMPFYFFFLSFMIVFSSPRPTFFFLLTGCYFATSCFRCCFRVYGMHV